MLKSSGALAAATLLSRILGMARDIVYSNFMGVTGVASAFMLAFQVPNLFRRLLGEGALTAAFIPIFKRKEVQEGEQEMWRAANAVISGVVISTAAVSALAMAGVSIALAVGTLKPETALMLRLLRIMFPYTTLVCLAAGLIGMANARNSFFIPALGASALNVVMIASVWFLAPHMGATLDHRIFALAIGVLVAGVAQAGFQLPTLYRQGFRYRWVSPWHDPTVHEVVRKMVPASIGVAAFQINVLLTQSFSFWFDERIVSIFYYAVRLMEFPQGMFGISLATYLLPTLSGLASEKKYPDFSRTLKQALGYLGFLNLLAGAMAFALAEPIVRLIFEHGKFSAAATPRVAFALMALAPGLFFFSAVNILARAFYALHDIRTPMKISIFCLGLNLVFAIALVQRFREAGLGAANTISAVCNGALLAYALKRKLPRLELAALRRVLFLLFADAALSAVAAWLSWKALDSRLGHAGFASRCVGSLRPHGNRRRHFLALRFRGEDSRSAGHHGFVPPPFSRGSRVIGSGPRPPAGSNSTFSKPSCRKRLASCDCARSRASLRIPPSRAARRMSSSAFCRTVCSRSLSGGANSPLLRSIILVCDSSRNASRICAGGSRTLTLFPSTCRSSGLSRFKSTPALTIPCASSSARFSLPNALPSMFSDGISIPSTFSMMYLTVTSSDRVCTWRSNTGVL